MCGEYYRKYYVLVACCCQLTKRDGDAQTCAAIAARERDNETRRGAVDALRQHTAACEICKMKA